jgi:hypothetical protein
MVVRNPEGEGILELGSLLAQVVRKPARHFGIPIDIALLMLYRIMRQFRYEGPRLSRHPIIGDLKATGR